MGVALAVEALQSIDEERRIALTLQRALLPWSLPLVEGVELAARYVPASSKAEIGGDFYEVIELGDKLLVAIGDVMGHSLHAATVMAEIRHAVRAYASEGHPLDEILRQVNILMLRVPAARAGHRGAAAAHPGDRRDRDVQRGAPAAAADLEGTYRISEHARTAARRPPPPAR